MDKNTGIISIPSIYTVAQTIDKLETALRAHGVTVYTRIDQQTEAQKAGLSLRPIQLLIFGNPKAGVPIMAKTPLAALDLPLKALAWEDDNGRTWLSYNSFVYLQDRYALPDELIRVMAGVEKLIREAIA
ncbi:MAG TPA: DUF302 domain-containing protein [Puia sp.]|nr:DUF302 domain-containing protein [Puia sp.]